MEPSVDSAGQEKFSAGDLVVDSGASRIDAFGIRVNRVSPSGKYISQLRIHKRVFPLWWRWESIGYSISPDYGQALQTVGRFVNQIGSLPTPTGTRHARIILEFGAVYMELPDGIE